jgi:hypothetical protein
METIRIIRTPEGNHYYSYRQRDAETQTQPQVKILSKI